MTNLGEVVIVTTLKSLVTLSILCLWGAFLLFGINALEQLRRGFDPVALLFGIFFVVAPSLAGMAGIVLTWIWD